MRNVNTSYGLAASFNLNVWIGNIGNGTLREVTLEFLAHHVEDVRKHGVNIGREQTAHTLFATCIVNNARAVLGQHGEFTRLVKMRGREALLNIALLTIGTVQRVRSCRNP